MGATERGVTSGPKWFPRQIRAALIHPWLGVMVGVTAAVSLTLIPWGSGLERLERRSHDLRFAWRGPRQPRNKVVLATVTDDTRQRWSEPRVFWGSHYARTIQEADRGGARAIGLDLVQTVGADEYLQDISNEVLRISGGVPVKPGVTERLTTSPKLQPNRAFYLALQECGKKVVVAFSLNAPPNSDMGHANTVALLARLGFAEPLEIPVDGVTRRLPLAVNTPAGKIWSFGGELATVATGSRPRVTGELLSLNQVPTQLQWVNYAAGTPGQAFTRIPLHRLAEGPLTPKEKQELKGAVVLIGEDSREGTDVHLVPGNQEFSGTEIQAHFVSSLLDGCLLRRTPVWTELLMGLTFGLLGAYAVRGGVRWGVPMVVALMGLWLAGAQRLFEHGNLLVPLVRPLATLPTAYLLGLLGVGLVETQRRRRVEQVFGQHVSPELRDYLVANDLDWQASELETDATVLFFDIRDSVGRAEERQPAEVLGDLNRFFERVIPAVGRNGGLLFRYTGDGFLAVFGAPRPLPNHAAAAVQAAREIVSQVRQINAALPAQARPWAFGCGIHSGPLVAGHLGSADRAEFTVIGDTVNLAARLQEHSRDLGVEVVVSETSFHQSAYPHAFGPLKCKVKGRTEPLLVYCLDQVPENPTPNREDQAGKQKEE